MGAMFVGLGPTTVKTMKKNRGENTVTVETVAQHIVFSLTKLNNAPLLITRHLTTY